MAKPALKTPTNEAVSQLAAIIVSKEVTRIIGPAGAKVCLEIGAYLALIHPLYQQYYNLVDKGEIHLETVKNYFTEEQWAVMTNAKRRALGQAITKEVELMKKHIQGHMHYLNSNDHNMKLMGPNGQAALQHQLRELMGEEVSNG